MTDTNARVAALLRDLSAVQTSKHSERAYARAAFAILSLERQLDELRDAAGQLPKIPLIGPSSLKVIHEALELGRSPTVDQATAARGLEADRQKREALRERFLSRAAVLAVCRNRRLRGPLPADCRCDLQMHSTWSDGSQSLRDIVATGLSRGYTHAAVTDHSHGLPIARGMSMDAVVRQHAEIDALNRETQGQFRLIKGVEANIQGDGSLDLAPDEILRFELVVAAPHSMLRGPDDQTARFDRVVKTRGIHILGHPRGRKYGSRPGVSADWDRIFAEAAKTRVAIEIDGDPSRQDLDYTLARRAVEAGCLIALDSDAHAGDEWVYAETAVAHARLAGVPKAAVINCWPLPRLLDWMRERARG